jgi:cell division protein FtsL
MTRSATRSLFLLGVTSLAAAAVLVSALAQVTAKHQARQLFVELERLKGERDQLQIEWGQLQLEQSTWATHARMESLGRGELALVIPAPQKVVLVAEQP